MKAIYSIVLVVALTFACTASLVQADCSTEDKLYETICPTAEADTVYNTLFAPFDGPKPTNPKLAKKFDDMETNFGTTRQTSMNFALGKIETYFNSIGMNGTLLREVLADPANFEFMAFMGEYTAANPGFLMLGPTEVSVATDGYPDYLNFAVMHEMSHVLDVTNDVGHHTLKTARRNAFLVARNAMIAKSAIKAAEIWADWLAASMMGSSLNKAQWIKAIVPFCRGASGHNYPNNRDRVLFIARNPYVYKTICLKSDNTVDNGARGAVNDKWFTHRCSDLTRADCLLLKLDGKSICQFQESTAQCVDVPKPSPSGLYKPSHGGYPGFAEVLRSNQPGNR